MRNHSQRSMNRLNPDGGSRSPRPGRYPLGAKKNEMKPASSSIPSDWYDEKSCSAPMHERKSRVHSAIVHLGEMLKTTSTDTTMPAMTTSVSAASDALIQSSVGAYQNPCAAPRDLETSWR